jgi:hypothetical protein
MRQTWRDLAFLHWPVEPPAIRGTVPGGLELDLHDGRAWIGLVPFRITDLTTPRGPAVPWLSSFLETNVRTYVVDRAGRRGVWFYSLDASRLIAVAGARVAYALAYYWSKMDLARNGDSVVYASQRRFTPQAASRIEVKIGDAIEQPGELEVFLTARFRLFARRGQRLLTADIEHPPWPLRRAKSVAVSESLLRAAGLPAAAGEPLTYFSSRVDVLVGAPKPV